MAHASQRTLDSVRKWARPEDIARAKLVALAAGVGMAAFILVTFSPVQEEVAAIMPSFIVWAMRSLIETTLHAFFVSAEVSDGFAAVAALSTPAGAAVGALSYNVALGAIVARRAKPANEQLVNNQE